MHYFHRLGTTPATHSPPSTSTATFPEEHIRRRRRNTGGVYSTRSQVRAQGMSYSNLSDNIPAGVRVDHGPFAGSEAVSAAKTEGNELAQSACGFSSIRKRAYKRALRRAQAHGSTMYRGRLLTSQVLLPMHDAPKQMSSRSRVEMISWNVDGLTDTLYAELQKWLRDNPNINLVMLQETHWTFTGEWSQSGWNYCHSCSGRKAQVVSSLD